MLTISSSSIRATATEIKCSDFQPPRSGIMKTFGPPIKQANSSVLLLPTSKTKSNLEQHFHPRNIASLSPVPLALQKPVKRVPIRNHDPKRRTKPNDWVATRNHIPKQKPNDWVVLGAVTVGIAVFVMSFDEQKALAFGPEGPLMEEFWDNMRRYALYVLTVSTGALYIVFQPILELLKNPISAILILAIAGGGFYIVSQVLSAMVGVSDFTYDYGY